MKNIICLFLLTLLFSCTVQEATAPTDEVVLLLPISMYDSPHIDRDMAMNRPYEINCTVEKNADDKYELIADLQLFGGSFLVSPHSEGDFKGKFRVEIAPNKDLELGSDFQEIPRTKEVIDPHPFVNGPVNWVVADTKYKYPLTIHSKEDFQIGGKIVFTIEPKCTLEEIPLMFKYKNGVLTVEKWKC